MKSVVGVRLDMVFISCLFGIRNSFPVFFEVFLMGESAV